MVHKISLSVKIPGLLDEREFIVPSDMKIGKIIQLIVNILQDEYVGILAISHNLLLVDVDSGEAFNPEFTPDQQNMYDGMKVILF